eukprot:TRINITY_DN11351_c0_g1_i6.p1 TRINITY_DN11351_c0_g1~~TRINITY_DN11351_c0_g1_i6.p1  ORF type:complete len:196 (+),score=79.88 TRINITY_DN11351_c0_g1_i6:65-652(+)
MCIRDRFYKYRDNHIIIILPFSRLPIYRMSLNLNNIDPDTVLTEKEKEKCIEAFHAFDKNGSKAIDSDELRQVLEEMGQKPTEEEILKMINEVDQGNKGAIDLNDFLKVIAYQKLAQQNNDEYDTIDAFVALGGSPDKKGYIDAEKLIKIIKEDFNMTIDIERLIMEIDFNNSGKIEYPEFKELLSNQKVQQKTV